jgi:hypothetical protein
MIITTFAARWHTWRATRRWKAARRFYIANRDLLDWARTLPQLSTNRGICAECGHEHAIRADGRIRAHRPCPGSGQSPARIVVGGPQAVRL